MKENKLNAFFAWFLIGITALLPIFFIPYIFNPFINSKLLLTFLISLIVLLVYLIDSLQKKSWEIAYTPFSLSLIVFAGLIIISGLVSHQYQDKQLLGLGGVYLSFVSIILFAPSLLKTKLSGLFLHSINIAAVVLSVLSILQTFDIGLAQLINKISVLNLSNDLTFSLTGNAFIAVQFLSIALLSNLFNKKTWRESFLNQFVILLLATGVTINLLAILPGKIAHFQNPNLIDSLSIAKDSLALTKNALLGYGPDSYGNAYNLLKPIWVNGGDYWGATFDLGFNLPLTIIVSIGFFGFLTYLFFLWKTFVFVKTGYCENASLKTFILLALIWQFLCPFNHVIFITLAIALAIFVSENRQQCKIINFNGHQYFFSIFNSFLILCVMFFAYTIARTFTAYHLLYQANASLLQNNASLAYDYHKKAKNLAPQIDYVRRNYSIINMQIAVALSNKADINAVEQEQILQLMNQAIKEAKAATVLDPQNYQNWLVLAQIYMQLIGAADQAQQEAFNALAKAATYNPSSPELRIALGQLFFNTNKYPEAITFFGQAVERKSNLMIAHHYLAKALIANNQLPEAKIYLINSLNLLDKDDEKYQLIENELSALAKQIEMNNNQKNNQPDDATSSASIAIPSSTASPSSTLSNFLDQEHTENVIQESALTPDQKLIEN